MTQPNRVAIALTSIFAGAAGGGAVGTIGAWFANWLNLNGKMTFGDPRNVLFGGVVLGCVLGFWRAWAMAAGVGETWRRAAIAVTACFGAIAAGMGAFPISMLSIMMMSPLTQFFLPGYLLLWLVIYVVAWRINARHRAPAGPATVTV